MRDSSPLEDCSIDASIQVYGNRIFVACSSTVKVLEMDTLVSYTFLDTSPARPTHLIISGDVFIVALSTLEINVYNFTKIPTTSKHTQICTISLLIVSVCIILFSLFKRFYPKPQMTQICYLLHP